VFLAVLSYFLFVACVIYVAQNPFPGFAGPLINIAGVTLVCAVIAAGVYQQLYGRGFNPFETREVRAYTKGLAVRASVYLCIVNLVFLSLNFMLVLQDLQRWEPFAQSVFFIVGAILIFSSFTAPPRRLEADALRESPTC